MSESAEMFKKLAQSRLKSTQAKKETLTQEETKPEPKTKPPKETKAKVKVKTSAKKITPKPTAEEKPPEIEIAPSEPTKRTSHGLEVSSSPVSSKRGRPATGKRSDPNWIGRTYYIRKENDLDIEDELIKLKRAGINLDKSSLVDFLLAAWVKWRKGENIDLYISEISPRPKDELP